MTYLIITAYSDIERGVRWRVSLYLRTGIPHTNRNGLEYFDSEMESVFIVIERTVFDNKYNIIVGVIHWMPDSSIE